jgi:hypothetical protein
MNGIHQLRRIGRFAAVLAGPGAAHAASSAAPTFAVRYCPAGLSGALCRAAGDLRHCLATARRWSL